MCHCCLSSLAVLCLMAVAGAAPGKDRPEQPAVSVSLDGWETSMQGLWPSSASSRSFSMKLSVTETSSLWTVAYVEEAGSELVLTDSEGSSSAKTACSYSATSSSLRGHKAGTIFLRADSWLPSEGATWVEAGGKMPFVVYGGSAVSESVALKLTVKDFSVPLVLKNAGVDGQDVKVELKGSYDREEDGGEAQTLRVVMSSSVPLGFMGFELCSPDGSPLLAEDYGSSFGSSPGHYDWERHFRMQEGRMEELKVSVTYAAGLKKIMVPVRIRCGMFGVEEQQDTGDRRN